MSVQAHADFSTAAVVAITVTKSIHSAESPHDLNNPCDEGRGGTIRGAARQTNPRNPCIVSVYLFCHACRLKSSSLSSARPGSINKHSAAWVLGYSWGESPAPPIEQSVENTSEGPTLASVAVKKGKIATSKATITSYRRAEARLTLNLAVLYPRAPFSVCAFAIERETIVKDEHAICTNNEALLYVHSKSSSLRKSGVYHVVLCSLN
ncbi:hypothetical protein FIBSPDRAFT_394947 [Athelia psychrophila]|uniref:Uncharacterized protein n=1 Tax=Athelia psychrophila TaxID=1759441 RepID=A0A166NMP3_9AGAM|nr:hypothetical protein FIBSPDRAFT_394947 [Fibularhizoctonia sp. CBS 109695]